MGLKMELEGGGREERSLFPGSESNSFVIHCVAGTSRREDGWMDAWTDHGRMAMMEGAGYQECSRRLFCGPQAKGRLRCAVPTLHFHFVDAIRVPNLILTFPMTLEALRLKGHRRSPPFPLMVLPPRSVRKYSPLAMHTYAPTFSVGNFCLCR